MSRLIHLLLSVVLVSPSLAAQAPPAAPADPTVYAVSYVEVMASARSKGLAALKQYKDASRNQEGYVRIDLFEQIGRPAHFAIVEIWRDQKAADARGTTVQRQLQDMLQPIRVSDWDLRPYKTLTVVSTSAELSGSAISLVSHVDVNQNPQVPIMLRRLADDSRRDPGNVRFDVLQHTMRANHFTVIETWQNQKALDQHVAAAHTKQYRDDLAPMTGSPIDERVFKAVE